VTGTRPPPRASCTASIAAPAITLNASVTTKPDASGAYRPAPRAIRMLAEKSSSAAPASA